MKVVYSEDHRHHFAQAELSFGQFVTPFERPSRVEYILRRLKERGFHDVRAPEKFDLKAARRVHDGGFMKFLETA